MRSLPQQLEEVVEALVSRVDFRTAPEDLLALLRTVRVRVLMWELVRHRLPVFAPPALAASKPLRQ